MNWGKRCVGIICCIGFNYSDKVEILIFIYDWFDGLFWKNWDLY